MKFSMTGLEKCDLLLQVTAWTGLIVYILPLDVQKCIGEGCDPINQLNSPQCCVGSKPGIGFPRLYVVIFFFVFIEVQLRGDCSFC